MVDKTRKIKNPKRKLTMIHFWRNSTIKTIPGSMCVRVCGGACWLTMALCFVIRFFRRQHILYEFSLLAKPSTYTPKHNILSTAKILQQILYPLDPVFCGDNAVVSRLPLPNSFVAFVFTPLLFCPRRSLRC